MAVGFLETRQSFSVRQSNRDTMGARFRNVELLSELFAGKRARGPESPEQMHIAAIEFCLRASSSKRSSLDFHVPHVVELAAEEQMVGIHARRIVASVKNA
jgi:hypothetical protein